MKCFQLLLLVFAFVSSTFAISPYKCKRGGTCGMRHIGDNYTMQEPKGDAEGSCYYYKCKIGDHMIMEGFGTHEDFINTCKYADPMIKQQATFWNVYKYGTSFMYNDDNLILAVCHTWNQEECEKIFKEKETYKKIHQQFDKSLYHITVTAFSQLKYENSCKYDNIPMVQLPQVQCETGGICQAGKYFGLWKIQNSKFVNKTCDACVMFVCSLDGKQIIEGTGCYDDFVKVCKNANPSAVARFKEKTKYRDDGIKSNFYHDNSMIVASCSDADNCHKYAFDNFATDKTFDNFYVDDNAEERCSYEKMIETTTTSPSMTTKNIPKLRTLPPIVTTKPAAPDAPHSKSSSEKEADFPGSAKIKQFLEAIEKSDGSTSMKLFFGIYFLLALIY